MGWRLESKTFEIDRLPGHVLVDADLGDDFGILALYEDAYGKACLIHYGQRWPLPDSATKAAIVRRLPNQMALVIAPRQRVGQDTNAWIVDLTDGVCRRQFSVGDAVEDVVVLKDYIAVSYFDEALGSHTAPSSQGLSFFSHDGHYLFGYRDTFHPPVFVCDCYGMAASGGNRLTFCAYTDFEIVELDLDARTQVIHPAPPEQIAGPRLVAVYGPTVLLIATYESQPDTGHRALYTYDLKTRQIVSRLETPFYLRAHAKARMLGLSDYTLHLFTPAHHL